jgi:Amt family ammonium transporter
MGFIIFKLLAMTIGLRVSPEEELQGLDLSEHRAEAYPDFTLLHPGGMGSSQQRVSPPTPLSSPSEQRR